MKWLLDYFQPVRPPMIGNTTIGDAAPIAQLHGTAFQRGWSQQEIEAMLIDRSINAHVARIGQHFAGFVMSRMAAGEAEILTIAVEARFRGRDIAGSLLRYHLGRLAAFGTKTVFLEVEDGNAPALRLYNRAGFVEIARREGYYPRRAEKPVDALVLRRDLQ
jgi:[ribosomal protein S18]-alanine N-acetyltransferase